MSKATKQSEEQETPKSPEQKQATEAKPKKKLKKLIEKAAQQTMPAAEPAAEVLSSKVVYEGPLFKVTKDEVREPNGHVSERDVIRHNGSVVILPIDTSKSRKDPHVILERQYRHAAGQYLWELPAGKIEPGEERLAGAKRELAEETGYAAEKWTELHRYYASPGFLGEWMQLYLAEELTPGEATPEQDETLEIFAMPLSQVEALIDDGKILDGKTLIAILLYKRLRKRRRK
ncbi:MAG TPA: NUDIX hydrolase [Acidobacteriaceae bacterium]